MTPSSTVPRSSAAGPDDGASERERAAAVAGVVARAEAAAGLRLDDLLIWRLAGGRPAGDGPAASALTSIDDAAGIDLLAGALEQATDGARRKAAGLHVTPRWLAEHLVALALPDLPSAGGSGGTSTVCDPACGGGAFLLAAARRLHARGVPRRDVVARHLWGADIDPVGLAAAEAALALWAGERPPPGRLVVADPLHERDVPWTAAPAGGFDAVVGNPPFQSQLGRATARPRADQRRLRARFGDAVRAYTDTAWLFLLVGCELARPGGRVVMIEPQSVVAARDAEAVRAATAEMAELRDLWVDGGRVFDAAVSVCAPVLERRVPAVGNPSPRPGQPRGRVSGDADRWSELLARAVDVPAVDLGDGPVLGERAAVVAGFRDQYYGLVDIVRERLPADDTGPGGAAAPLVTSGSVDWAACRWGERPARFAKRRWRAPVVDLARLGDAPPIVGRWVARTRAPKLVVATQTRVVEAAVDPLGTWVPSVPALAVVPADPDDVWRLAAAVLAPAATAWLARRAAGTGLDRGALKVAGPGLAALPLPSDPPAWDEAAAALARHVAATEPESAVDHLAAYLAAIERAYGTPATVTAWWRARAGTVVRSRPGDG